MPVTKDTYHRLIEDPSSKLEGIFDRKERRHFLIRSLTPQQATGNTLAIAVQVPVLGQRPPAKRVA
jgi:hypothetical protein